MFESLNRKVTVMEGVNTEGMEFKKLKHFTNQKLACKGFFFTTSKLDGKKQVVVVTDNCLVNMPSRAVEQFETIANNPTMLKAVLNGDLTIAVHEEVKTKAGSTIAYDLEG